MSDDIRNLHGAFSWAELMTTDPEGAKAFYTAVCGWETADMPMPPPLGTYTVANAGGKSVAGLMHIPAEAPAGMPPVWAVYITVKDLDAALQNVRDHGGTVVRDKANVPGVGDMALIADPQGAHANLIQYENAF